MRQLPDALRVHLGTLRVCRANGISPRVLVPETALDWLVTAEENGCAIDPLDDVRERVVAFGRLHLGARYETLASVQAAPHVFSCSSFTKYVFASVGIWLPRYAVDQSYVGRTLDGQDWSLGNLVFWKSVYPVHDPSRTIGHVGIVCDQGRALHAGGKTRDVHEFTSLRPDRARFVNPFPDGPQSLVRLPNEERGLETALDLVRFLQR